MNRYFNVKTLKIRHLAGMLGVLLLLSGCSDSSDSSSSEPAPTPTPTPTPMPPAMIDYRVTISNLTANQPLSPIAVIMHNASWQSFTTGEPASVELENLAESGSPADLIAAADSNANVTETVNGSSPLGPGGSESFDISIVETAQGELRLSVVTMLVNTNDAIATINSADISAMEALGSQTMTAISYDSGTEANTETAETIPGPVAGGEGFNAARDDIQDAVHVHGGVVTSQDGLANSVLDGTHKWDNPVMRVMVERLN